MLTWTGLFLRSLPQDLRLLGAEGLQTSQLLRQLRVGQSQIHPAGGGDRYLRHIYKCPFKPFVLHNEARKATLLFSSTT